MPRGDGTGPLGRGSGTPARQSSSGGGRGRGMGGGIGRGGGGRGIGRGGGGRGMGGGNRPGAGPLGNCVCPKCGARISHQRGIPCYSLGCTRCGTKMMRE